VRKRLIPVFSAIAGCLGVALMCIGCSASGSSYESPRGDSGQLLIAAASDLRPAFEDLAWSFTQETGINVTFSFGSSGQLREQIINGAPFDAFASANTAFVDEVIRAGKGVADSKVDYAYGRIVLWSAAPQSLPTSITDLVDPSYSTIAIANPQHAPYGIAAREALRASGAYDIVQKRLVYGENISDTLQIIKSGNATVGIIALSLAIADGRDYVLISDDLHAPLQQAIVITTKGERALTAQRWIDYISSPTGRAIMTEYGFVLPGDTQ
jgi:molybdate transport system substrate-binding protein